MFSIQKQLGLFMWNAGSRPYHKRQRQIFIKEQKMSTVAYNWFNFSLSPGEDVCLSGLLVEILCFPVRFTNETIFSSYEAHNEIYEMQTPVCVDFVFEDLFHFT